ncbi:MAG: thioredoxin fold domain-containing protein [Bergeyella sp.]
MKKLFSIFGILIFVVSFSQVRWITLSQALEAQKTHPKKILIDFYADWCGPCKLMEKNTYSHPVISEQINQNYYPVKFNAEGSDEFMLLGREFSNSGFIKGKTRNPLHDFTKYMNVSSVPSTVFLDETGNPITILNGFLSAKEIEPYLSMIAGNDYKKIKTREQWDDYQRRFRSKIKE